MAVICLARAGIPLRTHGRQQQIADNSGEKYPFWSHRAKHIGFPGQHIAFTTFSLFLSTIFGGDLKMDAQDRPRTVQDDATRKSCPHHGFVLQQGLHYPSSHNAHSSNVSQVQAQCITLRADCHKQWSSRTRDQRRAVWPLLVCSRTSEYVVGSSCTLGTRVSRSLA